MPKIARRHVLAAIAGLPVADASGAAFAAGRSVRPAPSTAAGPAPFDEVYQGRRIQGAASHGSGHHGAGHGGYSVRIDGDELHVMQNADGTWISVVNHYETFATPQAVARAAVVELQGAALVPLVLA